MRASMSEQRTQGARRRWVRGLLGIVRYNGTPAVLGAAKAALITRTPVANAVITAVMPSDATDCERLPAPVRQRVRKTDGREGLSG